MKMFTQLMFLTGIFIQILAAAAIFLRSSSSTKKFIIGNQAALTLTMLASPLQYFTTVNSEWLPALRGFLVQLKQHLHKMSQPMLVVRNVNCSPPIAR